MHEDEEHKEPPLPPAASAVTAESADFSTDATSFSANIENLLEILGCRLGFPDPPKSRNLHPEICHLPFLEAREASGEWRGAGQRESHGQELRRDRI